MAEPSRANWGGEPKDCYLCGDKVTLGGKAAKTHGGAVFRTTAEVTRSWHEDCYFAEFRLRRLRPIRPLI